MKRLHSISTSKLKAALFCMLLSAGLTSAFAQDSTGRKTSMPDTGRRKVTYPGFRKINTFGGRKQFSQWSLGVNAGVFMPFSPVNGAYQFAKTDLQFGYAGFLKWQIQHSFGLRLDYAGGKVGGSGLPATNAVTPQTITTPGSDLKSVTKLTYLASVKAEVDVASIDFLRRQDAVRLYLTGGYGLAGFKPNVTGSAYADNNGKKLKSGFIPVGVGLKFHLSEGLSLNLGYDIYFFNEKNLYLPGSASTSFSRAGFGYGGLEYTFGGSRAKALIWNNPVSVMYDELANNDSLVHKIDSMKQSELGMQSQIDNLKKDSDGDGVSDAFDKCANTPSGTKVDGSGCELPKPDTTTRLQPVIIQQDIEVVREAVRNLNFANNSTQILPSSFPSLDRLATLLVSKPGLHLKLTGYTDNVGSRTSNIKLSEGRASAVKDYLTQKGTGADRITVRGAGPAHPVASNKTAKGRARNRRVEFNLF